MCAPSEEQVRGLDEAREILYFANTVSFLARRLSQSLAVSWMTANLEASAIANLAHGALLSASHNPSALATSGAAIVALGISSKPEACRLLYELNLSDHPLLQELRDRAHAIRTHTPTTVISRTIQAPIAGMYATRSCEQHGPSTTAFGERLLERSDS
jgi:hypothetical protein